MIDDEVKDFAAISFSEYFKSTRGKLYSKLSKEQNLRKVSESLYIFITTPDERGKYAKMMQSSFLIIVYIAIVLRSWIFLIRHCNWIKNNLKELLSGWKKFKVQTILASEYKKRKDGKAFHSSVKLIASDSDINEALKSMHLSFMTKSKSSASKDWIFTETIVNRSIKTFECWYKQ